MEIIIQGKPISGSKISTSGIEASLVDRIYKDFFEKMGGVRTSQALVVDTIYWQNSWYSIYTYSRYSGIIDTADRQSYFALSIVVPKNFLYLTSGVYHLLQKVYKEKVEGVYLSKNGKYLVSDFSDTKAFNSIVEYISKEFANSNLEDPIDNGFQKNHTANIPVYNLCDCDSIAFLQDLKENGRVIVGEGAEFPQKCAASVIQSKEQQIDVLNAKLSEQNKAIDKLKKDLEGAQSAAQNSANNCSVTIGKLKAEIERLQKEKDQAISQISDKQQELDGLVLKIQELVPASFKKPVREEIVEIKQESSLFKRILNYLPIVNCVLLLIIVCLCFLLSKPSHPNVDNAELDMLRKENIQLQEKIRQKDVKIQEQEKTIQSFEDASQGSTKGDEQIVPSVVSQDQSDIDCHVQIKNSLTQKDIAKKGNAKIGDEVTITWNPQNGYTWYCTNLQDSCAKILKTNTSGQAIIPLNWVQSGKQKDLKISKFLGK